ncbi:b7a490ab-2979-4a99-a354-5d14c3ed9e85 [Sclerotinia trifoliorum]|uniref:B7a490ab-2979-4a99-a354-5d14c3ed9e85 n=1 Tax=Sclerotinia trifoliorum TaxID=28548 RepID=A0A8H2VN79_9HELO|nr:b7a490ab-2979-4a99-a354-5d14c3ed9e85 [Sclerotinia trifoliorum]
MPIISYHSTIIENRAAHKGAVDTTSSQILLSRAIADHSSTSCPPVIRRLYSTIAVTSVYESPTTHIMTIGDAASTSKDVGLDGEQMGEYNGFASSRYPSVPVVADASRRHNLHAASNLVTSIDDTAIDPPFQANPWELPQLESVLDEHEKRDKGKEVERGRTLERSPRYSNPLAKAESRPQRNKTNIEVDGRSIRTRDRSQTLHENPNDPCAIFDDQVLEPLIGIAQQDSFSEVLSGHASPASLNGSLDAKELKGRLRSRTSGGSSLGSTISPIEPLTRTVTTVYNDSTPVSPDPTLPVESSSCRLPSIDRLEESARQSTSFTFSKLPTEIIQQIYDYLTPADFNSARHTCRTWFFTSIDRSLLENMIRRGGWESSCRQEISETKCAAFRRGSEYDWFMSKRISRECALGPNWMGCGVPFQWWISQMSLSNTKIRLPLELFSRSHHDVDDWYDVQPGSLRPVTSIICPHRVLACSMDTSSHRYAIAALLDGRMGLVCDISLSTIAPPTSSDPGTADLSSQHSSRSDLSLSPGNDTHHGVSFLDRVSLDSSAPVQRAGRSTTAFVFPGIATTCSGGSSPGVAQRPEYNEASRSASAVKNSYPPEETGPHSVGAGSRMRSRLPARKYSNLNTREMPVETGTRSIYRNLCSEDDPPRSVAICPQRRCVAFGCSAGIELHWVDALTGQDLNRWFPLTAPSDFLFFLPPRKSIDSAKKLRLISSAASPSECAAVHERAYGRRPRGASFWQRIGWNGSQGDNSEEMEHAQQILAPVGRFRSDSGRRVDHSDHYRAVPLSDGYHILFTDPSTGALCLGSDAPVGGPTKLLRKVWFQGPEGRGSPTVYAGGSDLRWGVRVVAAFGSCTEQSIWMFSVPGDVFNAAQSSPNLLESSVVHKRNISKNSKNMQWLDWWPDEGLQAWLDLIRHPVPGILPGNMWPVRIKGQRIGTCSNIVDLAIDSSNSITIWAFSTDGIAKIWHVDDGKHRDLARLSVLRDGTIRENDYEGDIELNGTFLTSEILQHRSTIEQQSFDGTMSPDLDGTISPDISTIITARRGSGWSYQSVNYDSDGDVVMEDVYGPGVDMPATWSRRERVYEEGQPVQDQQYQYLMSRWPRSAVGYRRWWERAAVSGDMATVVEARGVTRIEIEIR